MDFFTSRHPGGADPPAIASDDRRTSFSVRNRELSDSDCRLPVDGNAARGLERPAALVHTALCVHVRKLRFPASPPRLCDSWGTSHTGEIIRDTHAANRGSSDVMKINQRTG